MSPLAVFPLHSGTGASANGDVQVKAVSGGRVGKMAARFGRFVTAGWTALLTDEALLASVACMTPEASIFCNLNLYRHPEE